LTSHIKLGKFLKPPKLNKKKKLKIIKALWESKHKEKIKESGTQKL
jgi:hypothetical protein